ncbi:variable large family protein [Borrelia sp. HM]|uniref:variable large family protein n=1 Tax=Borrelia sp. HM TaxID=1882662 RepID=UPI001C775337|nr:variable large family protein [Borrelia sp. HM]BCR21443.1 hypothetical protein BKFM_00003 [Borrelia sp. HM]
MEREGREMRGRRGREGGGEMRKRGRGIIVGGMTLLLLFGCNNGAIEELEKKNESLGSLVNLGNEFLNVFTSFGDMISGETLVFKTDSKKSDVRDYFKKVHEKVEGTKTALSKIVENMEKEGNPNASAVKTKVEELIKNKLNNIIEGAKDASEAIVDTGNDLLGNVASHTSAAGVEGKTESLIKGIKDIVDIVLKNEGDAEAGDDKKATDLTRRTGGKSTDNEAGKLFASDNAGDGTTSKKAAADAAKAVGAVTGADILKAMIKKGGDDKKDAVIAGTIALRAMAKDGKFAGPSTQTDDAANAIKRAAVSAVTKALDTLTIAIRKTIDEGLKTVKEAMKINANDSSVTSATGAAK